MVSKLRGTPDLGFGGSCGSSGFEGRSLPRTSELRELSDIGRVCQGAQQMQGFGSSRFGGSGYVGFGPWLRSFGVGPGTWDFCVIRLFSVIPSHIPETLSLVRLNASACLRMQGPSRDLALLFDSSILSFGMPSPIM